MCLVIKEKNSLFTDLFFSCVQVPPTGEHQEEGEELELKDDEKEKDENQETKSENGTSREAVAVYPDEIELMKPTED